MIRHTHASNITLLVFEGLIVLAVLLFAAAPTFAYAALYAYVNQQGEVTTVTANDPYTAIATAPNIDEHSGVMLLTNPNDSIIGDKVPGV